MQLCELHVNCLLERKRENIPNHDQRVASPILFQISHQKAFQREKSSSTFSFLSQKQNIKISSEICTS
jgi:hypothetical protein